MIAVNHARRLIPAGLKAALKKRLGIPLTRLHEDWSILRPIGPVEKAHVVIDAGAHHGWFFHCWKDWCPRAIVHAFEPQPDAFARSRELYGSGPEIHLNNVALGREPSRRPFNVLEGSRVSSSFLVPRKETWREIQYTTGEISSLEVAVIRLDDYAREQAVTRVHLLKIDVQGYEIEVLEGATEVLTGTDYVLVEAAIRPLYHGAPRFTDVHSFLDDHEFHLIAMRAWHRGNLTLIETDMLFRRNDLMPPIDSAVQRVTIHV